MNIVFSWPGKEWLAAVSIVLVGVGGYLFAPKPMLYCNHGIYKAVRVMDAQDYWLRGSKQFDLKNYQQAADDFKTAHILAPRNLNYAWALADTQMLMDDFEDAIKSYGEVMELGSRSSSVFNSRGYAYLKSGNTEAAFKDFDQVVERYPQDSLGYENRGWTYYLLGDLEKAKKDMDRAIAMDPNCPTAYIDRANLKLKLGDKKGAEADFRKVLSSSTGVFHRNYVARGHAQLYFGNKAAAKKEFEYALILNKYDTEAKAQLALLKVGESY